MFISHNMANIFLFSHILLLFHLPKGSWNKSAKYEKLWKYWSYCTWNHAITNAYVMQNAIQKFRQSSIVFEKPGIIPENLKTLTSSNYPTVQHFLLKRHTCFLLTNVYKACAGFFLFSLDLELFAKIKKDLVSRH